MREDWINVKFGELCRFSQGIQVPKPKQFQENADNRVRFLRIVDFTQGKEEPRYVEKPDSSNIVLKEDISMVRYGTVGFVCTGIEGAIANNLFRVIPQIKIEPKYLIEYLKSSLFKRDINSKGATMQALSFGLINPIPIPLAPLPEQRAIVAKIEELFSSLDRGIADLKKAQEQLKIYRQAVLKKAFEGGLTKEWRAKQDNLPTPGELLEQIKEERKNHYKQQIEDWKKSVKDWEANGKEFSRPGKPKKISDFITDYEEKTLVIPTTWREGVLECIADAVDPQPSHRTPPKVDGGVPFVSIADIDKITGEINFKDARSVGNNVLVEHINRYKLRKGDFVIGKIGTIGKPFFIPTERFFTLSANVVLVKPFERTCSPKFLFYFNISPQIEQQFTKGAKATTQAAFGIQKVRLLRVPLCAIEEQHQIVQEIESRLSVCDKVEESIVESLEKSKALRQSILKQAFEGRLLNEQELAACKSAPDYEPAAVLLERIKAEKIISAKKEPVKKKKK